MKPILTKWLICHISSVYITSNVSDLKFKFVGPQFVYYYLSDINGHTVAVGNIRVVREFPTPDVYFESYFLEGSSPGSFSYVIYGPYNMAHPGSFSYVIYGPSGSILLKPKKSRSRKIPAPGQSWITWPFITQIILDHIRCFVSSKTNTMNTTSTADLMNTIYFDVLRNDPNFVQSVVLTSHQMSNEDQTFALVLSFTLKVNYTQEWYDSTFKVIHKTKNWFGYLKHF